LNKQEGEEKIFGDEKESKELLMTSRALEKQELPYAIKWHKTKMSTKEKEEK
jgi:hypothetical protein